MRWMSCVVDGRENENSIIDMGQMDVCVGMPCAVSPKKEHAQPIHKHHKIAIPILKIPEFHGPRHQYWDRASQYR